PTLCVGPEHAACPLYKWIEPTPPPRRPEPAARRAGAALLPAAQRPAVPAALPGRHADDGRLRPGPRRAGDAGLGRPGGRRGPAVRTGRPPRFSGAGGLSGSPPLRPRSPAAAGLRPARAAGGPVSASRKVARSPPGLAARRAAGVPPYADSRMLSD